VNVAVYERVQYFVGLTHYRKRVNARHLCVHETGSGVTVINVTSTINLLGLGLRHICELLAGRIIAFLVNDLVYLSRYDSYYKAKSKYLIAKQNEDSVVKTNTYFVCSTLSSVRRGKNYLILTTVYFKIAYYNLFQFGRKFNFNIIELNLVLNESQKIKFNMLF
jgi:hypothetical protein